MSSAESSLVAWNAFLKGDALGCNALSPVVEDSWRRCLGMGVDPYDSDKFDIKGLELKHRLGESSHLIAVARPFMEGLYDFMKGTGFQVVLADAFGFILDVIGDRAITERTREVQLCPGGSWQESVKGTNAIGTAIVEKKPVQIFAAEHFCRPNHFLVCSAAPILDQDGQVIGVLDVSGDHVYANPHTLGMVVASVRAIENQLRLEAATRRILVAYKNSNALLSSISEGVVAATSDGMITQVNPAGARMLGVNPEALVGKHVNEAAVVCPQISDLLKKESGGQGKDILLTRSGRIIRTFSRPLLDQSGNPIGTVATLKDEGKDRDSVKKGITSQARYRLDDIIGESEAMAEAKRFARMAARGNSTVLLTGETGTGKELFAHAIHLAGLRGIGPFLAVNCGALPETLIESELFGHEEGSFTGSRRGGQPGKFELVNGGTIFLDEIGDMPMSTQVKLLRVIQEKSVARIGGKGEVPVDVRIIASTNKDLKEEVRRGTFREDLYYRLHVVAISIPALRERPSDIPLLIRYFVEKIQYRLDRTGISIDDEFLRAAMQYDWPGNVRELEHTIERALNMLPDDGLLNSDFLPACGSRHNTKGTQSSAGMDPRSLREIEREMIIEALRQCKGNLSKVSVRLGIGRSTLYRKIKSYKIPTE